LATFEAQIHGLTNLGATLSGSTNPTDGQVDQFLKDGVIDVTQRCISINPDEAYKFQRAATSDSNAVNVGGSTILGVMREGGIDGSSDGTKAWRPCRKIDATLQSRVIDTSSLYYASIYNPVYLIDSDKNVYVYPAPSSDNGIKILYVNEEPRDITNNAALSHAHENIKYFPNDKVYLVVIYAAVKALENAMAAKGIPSVASDSSGIELTTIAALDAENTIDDADGNAIEVDQWWSTAGHLIEGVEDLEMASSQLQKINAYIQAYSAQLAGNSTDYQWMQGRHQILSKQYEMAFERMRPAQPQQGAK
tara:strand:+ start:511 stop:1431 length:921 start_codon:yes stop_codon:yes gene_type:complete